VRYRDSNTFPVLAIACEGHWPMMEMTPAKLGDKGLFAKLQSRVWQHERDAQLGLIEREAS
jgi:hypothetical protein